jgi:hypothetical protein
MKSNSRMHLFFAFQYKYLVPTVDKTKMKCDQSLADRQRTEYLVYKSLCKPGYRTYLTIILCCLMSFRVLGAVDISPPNIIGSPKIEQAGIDGPVVLKLSVTDGTGVSNVTLNYRFGRVVPYFQLSEHRGFSRLNFELTSAGDYVATIPEAQVAGNVFEYYIEAVDDAGNVAHIGSSANPTIFTIAPLEASSKLITRLPAATPADETAGTPGQPLASVETQHAATSDDSDKITAWYENRWVWAAVGGIVLGTILSDSSSGSSSPTGSVTVSAPPL